MSFGKKTNQTNKQKNPTTPDSCEDVEKLGLSFIGVGNVKWYSHSLENTLSDNLLNTHWPNDSPGHLFQRNEDLFPYKSLCTVVYSSFICNSKKIRKQPKYRTVKE
jgi:hypothetical protein